MKKRFIVSTNLATNQQNEAFKTFIRANNFGWWRWLIGTWLIIDWTGQWDVGSIRDALQVTCPGVNCLVIEVPRGDTWAGFGTTADPHNMFRWIENYWDT